MTRLVDPGLVLRVGRVTLGRTACAFMDPGAEGHDHGECVRDDEAFAADQVMHLLTVLTTGDDDQVLDQVMTFRGLLATPS